MNYSFQFHRSIHLCLLLSAISIGTLPRPIVALPNASVSRSTVKVESLVQPKIAQELLPLKAQLQKLTSEYPFLSAGVSLIDLDTGSYINLDGEKIFPAASTIKLPILIAFFEAVDTGKIRLDELLTVTKSAVTEGSGDLQYSAGKQLTALATANKMITISDNTATNMIIQRLGGIKYLNQRFQSWGLRNTVIHNYLGDFKGTNKTTASDLVMACAFIAKHQILASESRSQVLDILNATENRKLLVAGLGSGAHIAHKTGDIGFVIGDAGIIEKPDGKLYLLAVFVRRPYNDVRARAFVQKLSRIAYTYFVPNEVANAE